MARKTISVTITAEGRDKGKTFVLTEMSAFAAEKWATRALLALTRARIDIPELEDAKGEGWRAMVYIGLQSLSGLEFAEAEPLLDEMLTCVMVQPERADLEPRALIPSVDFEEIGTILTLRQEVFELHASFFTTVFRSKYRQVMASQMGESS